jgi:hypothetical protein
MDRAAYQRYLESPEWHVLRRVAISLARHRCQLCNASALLHVHHRTYERVGGELPCDLIALCDDCHLLAHRKSLHPARLSRVRRLVEVIRQDLDYLHNADLALPTRVQVMNGALITLHGWAEKIEAELDEEERSAIAPPPGGSE